MKHGPRLINISMLHPAGNFQANRYHNAKNGFQLHRKWRRNIYQMDIFSAQQDWAWKKFYHLKDCSWLLPCKCHVQNWHVLVYINYRHQVTVHVPYVLIRKKNKQKKSHYYVMRNDTAPSFLSLHFVNKRLFKEQIWFHCVKIPYWVVGSQTGKEFLCFLLPKLSNRLVQLSILNLFLCS